MHHVMQGQAFGPPNMLQSAGRHLCGVILAVLALHTHLVTGEEQHAHLSMHGCSWRSSCAELCSLAGPESCQGEWSEVEDGTCLLKFPVLARSVNTTNVTHHPVRMVSAHITYKISKEVLSDLLVRYNQVKQMKDRGGQMGPGLARRDQLAFQYVIGLCFPRLVLLWQSVFGQTIPPSTTCCHQECQWEEMYRDQHMPSLQSLLSRSASMWQGYLTSRHKCKQWATSSWDGVLQELRSMMQLQSLKLDLHYLHTTLAAHCTWSTLGQAVLGLVCPALMVAYDCIQTCVDQPVLVLVVACLGTIRTLVEGHCVWMVLCDRHNALSARLLAVAVGGTVVTAIMVMCTAVVTAWVPLAGIQSSALLLRLQMLLLPALSMLLMHFSCRLLHCHQLTHFMYPAWPPEPTRNVRAVQADWQHIRRAQHARPFAHSMLAELLDQSMHHAAEAGHPFGVEPSNLVPPSVGGRPLRRARDSFDALLSTGGSSFGIAGADLAPAPPDIATLDQELMMARQEAALRGGLIRPGLHHTHQEQDLASDGVLLDEGLLLGADPVPPPPPPPHQQQQPRPQQPAVHHAHANSLSARQAAVQAALAAVYWPAPLELPAWLEELPVPHAFRCPITLTLMREPAQANSGVTYERSAICQWLQLHRVDPITQTPLKRHRLTPNLNLRQMIEDWAAKQTKPDTLCTTTTTTTTTCTGQSSGKTCH